VPSLIAPSPAALHTHQQRVSFDDILQFDTLTMLSLLCKRENTLAALFVECLQRILDLDTLPQRPAKGYPLELASVSE
jgi:hypothetical protein